MREEDIPIDINYNKLLDWLIDRRHCTLKWQQNVIPIKEKIQDSLHNIYDNEGFTEIIQEPNLNYFHCQKVKKYLEECGEGNKNIFGQYSSQIMKAWDEILQLYNHENVYLAEAAADLMRKVNYEIPSLKKQIARCQQTQRDCSRKESEYISNAATFKEKYLQSCKEMGIEGLDIKKELLNLVTQLPSVHDKIAGNVKELADVVEYYGEFANFIVSSTSQKEEDNRITVSPLLTFMIKNGNATVHQWKTGEVPVVGSEPHDELENAETVDSSAADANGDGLEIDWGDLSNGVETAADSLTALGDIDWSSVDAVTSSVDGIDFGEADADQGEIDWRECIEVVDASTNNFASGGIVVEEGNTACSGAFGSKKAKDDDMLTVLDCTQTRNVFVDELLELQGFLAQRRDEMSLETDVISVNQFQSAPVLIQLQNREKVLQMQRKVTAILDEMSSTKMQNLYLLRSSERFVHRIADSLQQKLKISENMLRQARLVAERRREALELQRESEPKLQDIVTKTKELQKQISQEISKRYKNRTVNIMGDINII